MGTKRFLTEIQKVSRIMKEFQLKPVKSMTFAFDPFTKNCESIREVLNAVTVKRIQLVTPVFTKVDVKSDRTEPQLDVVFNDGHKLIFKTQHLTSSEIVTRLKEMCNDKDSQQPEADLTLNKMTGKAGGKKKKK